MENDNYNENNSNDNDEPISNEMKSNDDSQKKINIIGTNTRYLMKKATKQMKPPSKRVLIENLNIEKCYFEYEAQYKLLHEISDNFCDIKNFASIYSLIISQLERKIYSYKQQDNEKNIYNESEFIDLKSLIARLVDCKLKCYYCNCEVFILYEMSREGKQWTVDRIDNKFGHNKENYVIACLTCNLKRRCKTADKFMFTQQLKLVKTEK